MTVTRSVLPARDAWIELDLSPLTDISADAFFDLCRANPTLRFERLASGEIVVMPPAGFATGHRNIVLATAIQSWAARDGTGIAVDSSTGFELPGGATRSPDVAWVRRDRLTGFSRRTTSRFLPLCPDFVLELRSPNDRLAPLRAKMAEYLANGARLGWLIDPEARTVTVYRPGSRPERLVAPARILGDPELPGLVVELDGVWDVAI